MSKILNIKNLFHYLKKYKIMFDLLSVALLLLDYNGHFCSDVRD